MTHILEKQEIFDAYEKVFDERVEIDTWAAFQREYLDPHAQQALQFWQDSLEFDDNGDFTVYDSLGYHKELFISYLYASRYSIANTFKFLDSINVKYKDFAVFEDFPGMGLTTLDLIKRGIRNINVRQANEEQLNFLKVILGKAILGNDYNKISCYNELSATNTQYDIVFSLETLEHYREFMPYLRDITNLVKNGGYFVLAKCFSAKTMYTGHFNSYLDNGKILTHYQASKMIREYLHNSGFELLFTGYNAKPLVYQLK